MLDREILSMKVLNLFFVALLTNTVFSDGKSARSINILVEML